MYNRRRIQPDSLKVIAGFRPGSALRPTLRIVEYAGEQLLLKDFSSSGFLFRTVIGRFLAHRESKVYKKLSHATGIPQFFGRVGCDGILLEYVRGGNTTDLPAGGVEPEFFRKLEDLLSFVLSTNVVHLDIAKNLLVSPNGDPVLVDFEASVILPGWFPSVARSISCLAMERYRREILHVKERLRPDLMTAEDKKNIRAALSSDRVWTIGVRLHRVFSSLTVLVMTGKWVRWNQLK